MYMIYFSEESYRSRGRVCSTAENTDTVMTLTQDSLVTENCASKHYNQQILHFYVARLASVLESVNVCLSMLISHKRVCLVQFNTPESVTTAAQQEINW